MLGGIVETLERRDETAQFRNIQSRSVMSRALRFENR
jgi:hypothetical protein